MNYTQFKLNRMKRNGGLGYHSINLELTNLSLSGKTYAADGEAYSCKLIATNGKYLPQVIDIIGTVSRYAFKYDYTTGEIYIPSGEIYKDIKIIAEASDINYNVPASLKVAMCTSNTDDGTTEYTGETFLSIVVYPSRGSTVTINYAGVTKQVTGSLAKDSYECPGNVVIFGTFHGQSDGVTQSSGNLTISGAYDSYGGGTFDDGSKYNTNTRSFIQSIEQLGAIRYIPSNFLCDTSLTVHFENYIEFISSKATTVESKDQYLNSANIFIFDKLPLYAKGQTTYGDEEGLSSYLILKFNNVDWNEWITGDRRYMAPYYFSKEEKDALTYPDEYNETQKVYINGTDASTITKINLNEISLIGAGAFRGFNGLTSVTIPSNIVSIGDYAFEECYYLTSVDIDNGVTSIGNWAFYSCSRLVSITIPDSVIYIGTGAFKGCTNLTSIAIPDSVTSISNYTFEYCYELSSIVIPNSVTSIGYSAFNGCTGLKDVYYRGTEEQWLKITIGSGNESLTNATINFLGK